MAGPAAPSAGAQLGSSVEFSTTNLFDWLYSNPFESEGALIPRNHIVPRIEDERPVFVDNASGMCLLSGATALPLLPNGASE